MEQLSIGMVEQTGGFVGAPVKKEISWTNLNGETVSAFVYVRLASYERAIAEHTAQASGEDYLVSKIVASICDEKGKAVFTPQDVRGSDENGNKKLCASLFIALIGAINEANGYTENAVKN